jgi:prephenate dehydrogenase
VTTKRRSSKLDRYSVAIIGTGLIGTSVGLALKKRSPGLSIVGWDPNRRHANAARRSGAIDRCAATFESAVTGASTTVLAAPLEKIVHQLPAALALASPRAFLIDVGPLFAPVVAAARPALRRRAPVAAFVAGHPLAGSEHAGPQHAAADLFEERSFALFAPPQRDRSKAWRTAERFVKRLGATPVRVDPAEHDRVVAATSALPQLASLAVALAAQRAAGRMSARLSGPGFEGATRLAGSPFSVWERTLISNAGNTLRALQALDGVLNALKAALKSGDLAKIEAYFRSAAAARRRILGTRNRKSHARNR